MEVLRADQAVGGGQLASPGMGRHLGGEEVGAKLRVRSWVRRVIIVKE